MRITAHLPHRDVTIHRRETGNGLVRYETEAESNAPRSSHSFCLLLRSFADDGHGLSRWATLDEPRHTPTVWPTTKLAHHLTHLDLYTLLESPHLVDHMEAHSGRLEAAKTNIRAILTMLYDGPRTEQQDPTRLRLHCCALCGYEHTVLIRTHAGTVWVAPTNR